MAEMTDLRGAAAASVDVLRGYTDRDWRQVYAAGLDWTCWKTALHMVDCLYFYAMQILYGHTDDYLCTELALDDSATPPRVLVALTSHADLLERTARSADPEGRAHHNYGVSDPAGFAAMGAVETLIHTFDMVQGMNPVDPWKPPAELAAPVIARLFPNAPSGEPTEVFMYCCGRAPLGDLPQQAEWRWDGRVRS